MPQLKPISGHSKDMTKAGCYFMFKKDEHGRHLEENGVRALAFDGINIAERSIIDPDKWWWDVMNETRERFGNNEDHGEQAARTYEHFMISPDPRDDISLEDFRDYCRQWARDLFDDPENIGRYQVAIVYHDDSSERIDDGMEGILHAHVIVNNTELDTGNRIAAKRTKSFVGEMYKSLNIRALERGWRGFTTDNRSMTLAEMAECGATPSTTKWEYREWTPEEIAARGAYLGRGAAGEEVRSYFASERDADPAEGRIVLEFASGAVYRIAPDGAHTNPTMAERRISERGEYSWKFDIRDRVSAALAVSTSYDDFRECLDRFDVDLVENKSGEPKYCLRGEGNASKTVLGKTLGKRYARDSVMARLAENAYARASAPGSGSPDPGAAGFRARLVAALEGDPEAVSPNRAFDELHDLIDYNERHGVSSYEDYPDDLRGRLMALRAASIDCFGDGGMPDAARKRPAEMTDEERLALLVRVRAAGGGGSSAGGGSGARPGYGTHAGRDAGAAEARSETSIEH